MMNKENSGLREKSVQALQKLSPEQEEIARSKKIDLTRTATECLSQLEDLAKFDEFSDEYIKKKGSGLETLWIFTVLYLIAVLVLALTNLLSVHFSVYILLAGIVGIPWLFYKRNPVSRFGKLDLPNYFRQFVIPLLFYLREESKADEQITLKMDMRRPHKQMNRTKNEALTSKERKTTYYRVGQKFYDCPLVEIHTKLADDTQLNFYLDLLIRVRERYKSKGNKTKLKVMATWSLDLVMLKKNYQLTQNPPQGTKGIQLKVVDKPKKHIFRMKASKPVYTTQYATKGNRSVELNKLAKHITNEKVFDLPLFIQMMGTAFRQVKRIQTK